MCGCICVAVAAGHEEAAGKVARRARRAPLTVLIGGFGGLARRGVMDGVTVAM
jgi:hypothetical protein